MVRRKISYIFLVTLLSLSLSSLAEDRVGGWSPLDSALYWGSDEAALHLLESGAAPTLATEDETPLLVASRQGFPRTVKWLLKNGADPMLPDSSGRTALHHAASFGGPEVVRLLLDAGADQSLVDNEGYTPFQLAAKHSALESLNLLLPNEKAPETALPEACGWGSPEVVERLLNSGVSEVPQACVELAAGRTDFRPACRILELLLPKAGLNSESLTPAIRVGNVEAVDLLLKAGPPPGGRQAALAAEMADPRILQALLSAGAPGPKIEVIRDRWKQRRALLQATIERYSRMRCLHPAEAAARRALLNMDENCVVVERLLI